MTRSWAQCEADVTPRWSSDITDDGTPFEFSLAFTQGEPKLRFLVESQVDSITEYSTWDAGLALNARLERQGLVDLSRFARVQEIFRPRPGSKGQFLLWHAAVVPESGPCLVKAYFNPAVHGATRAPELIEEAMRRLGYGASWAFLASRLRDAENRALYFSLDLSASRDARLKVYIGRADSCAGIDRLIEGAENYRTGDATTWIEAMLGAQSRFDRRPMLACFAFKEPGAAPRVALHVPVRCYRENDAASLDAVKPFLSPSNAARLASAVEALAWKPVRESLGILTYTSFCRGSGCDPDVTVYLAPVLYARHSSPVSA
jgi:hypothetical protein